MLYLGFNLARACRLVQIKLYLFLLNCFGSHFNWSWHCVILKVYSCCSTLGIQSYEVTRNTHRYQNIYNVHKQMWCAVQNCKAWHMKDSENNTAVMNINLVWSTCVTVDLKCVTVFFSTAYKDPRLQETLKMTSIHLSLGFSLTFSSRNKVRDSLTDAVIHQKNWRWE